MKRVLSSSELGDVIRSERKRLKVTQKQLAMVAGVGLRYLIELERGKSTARLEGVFKIMQALGLQMSVDHKSQPQSNAKL